MFGYIIKNGRYTVGRMKLRTDGYYIWISITSYNTLPEAIDFLDKINK